MLEVLYSTGMRVGELISLRIHDVDLSRGLVTIHGGKGNKDRVTPLGTQAVDAVRDYLERIRPRYRRSAQTPVLFLSSRGRPLFRSAVFSLKLNEKPVTDQIIGSILALFCLYMGLFILGALMLAATLNVPGWSPSYQLETAVTASAACIGNVGPGLSGVGAKETYHFIPMAGKWVLIVLMLLGRLEVYSVIVLLLPGTWKR